MSPFSFSVYGFLSRNVFLLWVQNSEKKQNNYAMTLVRSFMDGSSSIIEIKGVGEKTQKLFSKLDIETVRDLIYDIPKDYDKYEAPCDISNLVCGKVQAVRGRVTAIPYSKKVRNLEILQIDIRDTTGVIRCVFFNMPYLKKSLNIGTEYIFRGLVQSQKTSLCMEQPKIYKKEEYEKLQGVLMPCYSLTKGLTNQTLAKAVKQVLPILNQTQERFSSEFRERFQLLTLCDAVRKIHFPTSMEEAIEARRRLVFDEFFDFLLYLRKNKAYCISLPNQYTMFETADTVRFLERLPFPLTRDQKKVWQEIKDDLNSPRCMNRLIQGDVGSGKTILAVLALLLCVANGNQGAMMAPTEVLAVQHFETIKQYTREYDLPFRPVLLVGSMSAKEKKEAYSAIAGGTVNVILGTHALIQEKVIFQSLALVITDEQHRFGVHQRENLANKGKNPHVLVMSATPIPRTLAIILYGDLDISVIKELPSGRQPIKNCVVNSSYRNKAYEFIRKEIDAGHQAYVICPQVMPGDTDILENVIDYTEKLRAALPAGISIQYLHGKMKPAEKNRIMEEFVAGNIHVLVSTTVIEVGINCPNATVMMVENAQQFGLAQLHQLRGRVGRGVYQSYCIFVNTSENEETMKRLEILNHSNDGFYIASEDLRLRGPGDIFGFRQSGEFSFHVGNVYTDADLLKLAGEAVDELLAADPELALPQNQVLKYSFENDMQRRVDFRTI